MSSLWPVYTGRGTPHDGIDRLPPAPPWRDFDGGPALETPGDGEHAEAGPSPDRRHRARTYRPTGQSVELVNAALYLRRPLLVTGPPGSGKSSLAYAVARELRLGPVLRWNITSRSTLHDGLYQYDPLSRLYAAGRAQARDLPAGAELQDHLRLGPLGTALLPYRRPRVLLVDEIDKGDLDLPGDLLNVLEDGRYEIPELVRAARHAPRAELLVDGSDETVPVLRGEVRCRAFPFIVLTSNGEREFPPAFLRRCITLQLRQPTEEHLEAIVRAHFDGEPDERDRRLIARFRERARAGELATDQLLNALYLTRATGLDAASREDLADQLMPYLSQSPDLDDDA